ncbi:putative ribonuclease H-like domain-containing protein [Tanacetum coccineum]
MSKKAPTYGLHQAPSSLEWTQLATLSLSHGFQRGKLIKLFSSKCHQGHILLVHNFVDDIILDLPRRAFVVEKKRKGFGELMKDKFHMSSIGELTFFMGLQTSRPDIMVAVCAFQVSVSPKLPNLFIFAYTDSDYAGATLDRKSTTGGCQFLGNRLISWQCKKQTVVATSTTEAEYVAAANCCGQVLWIQNQLLDYGYNFMSTIIYIDNTSTICIIENPVQHSKTKHIEIRHHFIRDCNTKKLIQMAKIDTQLNVADLLTKGFDAGRFQYLVSSIGMLNP